VFADMSWAVALPARELQSSTTMPNEPTDPLEVLQRKGVSMACPACGRREWASSGRGELIEAPRTEVYLLSCRNCGFVRMHDMDFLIERD
jgi:predicted RNA-binding Zn-ribbon protein involved in translation (DUF1610 family)